MGIPSFSQLGTWAKTRFGSTPDKGGARIYAYFPEKAKKSADFIFKLAIYEKTGICFGFNSAYRPEYAPKDSDATLAALKIGDLFS